MSVFTDVTLTIRDSMSCLCRRDFLLLIVATSMAVIRRAKRVQDKSERRGYHHAVRDTDILLNPKRLWCREEILARPSPVPGQPGVYAWYFRQIPRGVPIEGCIRHQGSTLLYVGMSPKEPSKNSATSSRQTLRSRLRQHFAGNASGSTVRLSVGCLLSEQLGIQLRRVGHSERMTFANGEQKLSAWLGENAFVTWMVDTQPWLLEGQLIGSLSLPLNLDQNAAHRFCAVLSAKRREARSDARVLPVLGR